MSRITLNAATHAGQKMADAIYNKKIDEAKSKLCEYVDSLYQAKVPQEIRSIPVMFPERLRTCLTIEFNNVGLGLITTFTSKPHLNVKPINISDSEYRKLQKLKDDFNDIRNERVRYLNSVAKCLVRLKTTNAVKKDFPEALEYLGEGIDDNSDEAYCELRKKLQEAKTE